MTLGNDAGTTAFTVECVADSVCLVSVDVSGTLRMPTATDILARSTEYVPDDGVWASSLVSWTTSTLVEQPVVTKMAEKTTSSDFIGISLKGDEFAGLAGVLSEKCEDGVYDAHLRRTTNC